MFKLLKLSANFMPRSQDAGAFHAQPARGDSALADIAGEHSGPVERLMRKIDYYMHCELDAEYSHERPEVARRQLIDALNQEFAAAAIVLADVAPLRNARQTAPNDPLHA